MQFSFAHNNFNVRDLDRSLAFYREALGLHEVRRNEKPEFTIVFMADDTETFELEPDRWRNAASARADVAARLGQAVQPR